MAKNSKWDVLFQQRNKDDPNSPVDSQAEVQARILNTRIGVVDTLEELDAQLNNLGAKGDTPLEAASLAGQNLDNEDEPEPNTPTP